MKIFIQIHPYQKYFTLGIVTCRETFFSVFFTNMSNIVIIFILTSGDNSFSLFFLFLMFSMNHLLDCVGFLSGAGKLMLKESLTHLHPGTFRVVTKKDGASMSIEDTCVRNTM